MVAPMNDNNNNNNDYNNNDDILSTPVQNKTSKHYLNVELQIRHLDQERRNQREQYRAQQEFAIDDVIVGFPSLAIPGVVVVDNDDDDDFDNEVATINQLNGSSSAITSSTNYVSRYQACTPRRLVLPLNNESIVTPTSSNDIMDNNDDDNRNDNFDMLMMSFESRQPNSPLLRPRCEYDNDNDGIGMYPSKRQRLLDISSLQLPVMPMAHEMEENNNVDRPNYFWVIDDDDDEKVETTNDRPRMFYKRSTLLPRTGQF